ncbi:hypothetical protein HYV89_00515 [Candidatus Woesearchaeota archaeon]|nr:hypothetical protein [Candidatus Woesearchaeota archaeon]
MEIVQIIIKNLNNDEIASLRDYFTSNEDPELAKIQFKRASGNTIEHRVIYNPVVFEIERGGWEKISCKVEEYLKKKRFDYGLSI